MPKIIITTIGLLAFLMFQRQVYAKDVIIWNQLNVAPFHITTGELKGEGYGDKILEFWRAVLPEYKHEIRVMNFPRLIEELKDPENNNCTASLIKMPAIADHRAWGRKLYIVPPMLIVTRPEVLSKKLGNLSEISFEDLINRRELKFGYVTTQNYSKDIDTIIAKNKGQKNLYGISSGSQVKSLLLMINKKRIDWMVAWPHEAAWFLKSEQTKTDKLSFATIAIKGFKADYSAFPNCSKNEWGKKIIDKINSNITPEIRKKFHSFYESWLIDKNSIDLFRSIQKEEFGY